MAGFARKGNTHGRAHGRGFARGFSTEFSKMIRNLAGIAGISAAGIILGKQFVASMKDAAARERFEVGVSAITGDADVGAEFFAHLREEARRTGADIGDLALSARRMVGMGLSVTEAKKLTASILDIQGSLSLTNDEAKRLTVGLLQVKSKGVASMEELRQQIAEKGVPIFQAMQEALDFDAPEDLFKAIEQGLVPAQVVLDIFMNLTGEFAKFQGGASKMAQTLGGAFNVMIAHWRDLRIDFSSPIADTIRPILREVTDILAGLNEDSGNFGERVAQGIGLIHVALKNLTAGELFSLIGDGLKFAILGAMVAIQDGLTNMFTVLLDPGFWDTFESKFQVIAVGFGATLLDGMRKAAGFGVPQEAVPVLDPQTGEEIGKFFRPIDRFEEARKSGDPDQVDAVKLAQKINTALGDPRKIRDEIGDRMAETMEGLEARRIHERQLEADRQRKLREADTRLSTDVFTPLEKMEKKFFPLDANGRTIYPSTLNAGASFSGLDSLRKIQSRARIEGSDFGTPFKPSPGAAGGRIQDTSQVSLQDAVDFLFGGTQLEEEKKGNVLREKIEQHLSEISKKDPVKIVRQLEPAFAGR